MSTTHTLSTPISPTPIKSPPANTINKFIVAETTPDVDGEADTPEPPTASIFAHLTPSIVAIDGPAASGKSTVGFSLAGQMHFLYFDTGVMYRAITWGVLHAGIDPHDQAAVGAFAQEVAIDILPPQADQDDGRANTILVADHDVTWQIRTPEVDRNVSAIAANPLVREALTSQQRQIALRYGTGAAEKPGVIMVGRDIGTIVVPESPLKIYLDATAQVRARRRYNEQLKRGKDADYEQILTDIYHRDQIDSEREVAPLRAADDAIILDTSNLGVDEVVERILLLGMQ